jgi:hypothetical protein
MPGSSKSEWTTSAAQRGIRIESRIPESLPARIDPDRMERIADNLLSNALMFTPEGGRVRVPGDPSVGDGPSALLISRAAVLTESALPGPCRRRPCR